MDTRRVVEEIWRLAGGPEEALAQLTLTGMEPVLPSSFRVGTAAQASIAAGGLAAAELWRLRSGRAQEVSVDMRHAAVEFRSERYQRLDGAPPPRLWDEIAGVYQAGDGRWLRLHTNFPHHRQGVIEILGCDDDREAVEVALGDWKAADFEDAAAARGLVVTMMRAPEEWRAHPQGQALARQPLVSFEKIGEAPPRPLPAGDRPLAGVRVLDLTRIIAGPVCGRTLAAHGADVLRVTGPHLPSVAALVMDAGRGKLSTYIDFREESDREIFRGLLAEADVLVQGYRPGAIAGWGFSPEAAAEIRPGLVYVSLCAYGYEGPWAERRGFDSLVQTASGINFAEAEAAGIEQPKELPCQALDHASGHLMAFAAMMALRRRVIEGGGWHARVSLARTGRWFEDLGRVTDGLDCADPTVEDVADLMEEQDSGYGRLGSVRHAALLSETPARWTRPSMPLGSHPPEWPG